MVEQSGKSLPVRLLVVSAWSQNDVEDTLNFIFCDLPCRQRGGRPQKAFLIVVSEGESVVDPPFP